MIKNPFTILFKKEKIETIEQMVYDAYYNAICPVCRTFLNNSIHKCENYEKKEPYFDTSILLECPNCHNAVFGKLVNIIKTHKTYEYKNKNELLTLIKEERII
jgi:hypothetical protein